MSSDLAAVCLQTRRPKLERCLKSMETKGCHTRYINNKKPPENCKEVPMKKLVVLLLVLTTLMLAVNVGSLAEGGKKTELIYWANPGQPHQEMVDLFVQAHPDVDVKLVEVPSDDMRNLITAAVSSGTGPDIFYFETSMGQVEPLMDAEMILDLEAYADQYGWKERITPFALAEATHRGKLWAIPNETEFIGMYYNRTILEEIGCEEPQNWDEMIECAEKAEAAGYKPFIFGNLEKWTALHRIGTGYQWNPGGKEAVADAIFNYKPLDSEGFIEGLELLMELDKAYWPDAVQLSHNEAIAAFLENQALFFNMGTWLVSDILTSGHPEDFGLFVPFKPHTDERSTIAGAGAGWYVSSTCKTPDLAMAFLDTCISDAAQTYWVQYGFVPAVEFDVLAVEGVSEQTVQIVDTMNDSMEGMGYYIHHFLSSEQSAWIQNGYQSLLLGQITPAEYAAEFQRLWEQAIDEGFTN